MDKNKQTSAIVPESENGIRLDVALAELFPELGLRARRRLWEWCRVFVDGREFARGEYVYAGQKIEIIPCVAEAENPLFKKLHIVASLNGYCAACKPAGLPSARIGGGRNYSAEEYLQENWESFGQAGEPPFLCNRLDAETSGLLLLAFGQNKLERFRELEAAGKVKKHYHALVFGPAPAGLYLGHRLNVSGRAKTLVLEDEDPDTSRHTVARCLERLEHNGREASLLDILIKRGARHQIRAHLAAAGFSIIGDKLYGGSAGSILYLHHRRIDFEGFAAEIATPWPFETSA